MEKHGVTTVDLLSIDAEGSDYEIFCSIDVTRYRPRILVIETGGMSPAQRGDLATRLADIGLVYLTRVDILTEAFVDPYLRLGRFGVTIGKWLRRLGAPVSRAG